MIAAKPITIIGGGLAGLTLGIALRQRGVPVTIWEAGRYPRHRVCGEFISGNGLVVLERLGLRAGFEKAGAFQAGTAQFIAGSNRSPVREIPPALCLSRYEMDRLLAEEFQRLGGELRVGERWNAPLTEGVIRASGRRPQPTEQGWRWFGLKAHARGVTLNADLEMHISSNSYVGVNRINGGEVNVCGLFRARAGEEGLFLKSVSGKVGESESGMGTSRVSAESKFELLRGAMGSSLRERLANAEFDDNSFCSVAGLSLQPKRVDGTNELCIGDALTMIPPATGNGMSMAFESAEMAVEPLVAFCRARIPWQQALQKAAEDCDAAFAGRLRWARVLQGLMFSPVTRTSIGALLLRSQTLWDQMFKHTR